MPDNDALVDKVAEAMRQARTVAQCGYLSRDTLREEARAAIATLSALGPEELRGPEPASPLPWRTSSGGYWYNFKDGNGNSLAEASGCTANGAAIVHRVNVHDTILAALAAAQQVVRERDAALAEVERLKAEVAQLRHNAGQVEESGGPCVVCGSVLDGLNYYRNQEWSREADAVTSLLSEAMELLQEIVPNRPDGGLLSAEREQRRRYDALRAKVAGR